MHILRSPALLSLLLLATSIPLACSDALPPAASPGQTETDATSDASSDVLSAKDSVEDSAEDASQGSDIDSAGLKDAWLDAAPDETSAEDAVMSSDSGPDSAEDGAADSGSVPDSATDTSIEDSADAAPALDIATDSVGDVAPEADAGADSDVPPCKSDLDSVKQMPPTAKKVDFESCTGCSCCTAGGSYPKSIPIDCLKCGPKSALSAVGGKLQGGMLTSFVSCIQGNVDAPLSGKALFVSGGLTLPSGNPGLIIDFNPPVALFGFSGVATASSSQPHVVLSGFNKTGALVAQDAFDFTGKPGGSCATTNPVAQFFGFRPCGSALMTRVVLETSDANMAIDEVQVWRPQP